MKVQSKKNTSPIKILALSLFTLLTSGIILYQEIESPTMNDTVAAFSGVTFIISLAVTTGAIPESLYFVINLFITRQKSKDKLKTIDIETKIYYCLFGFIILAVLVTVYLFFNTYG